MSAANKIMMGASWSNVRGAASQKLGFVCPPASEELSRLHAELEAYKAVINDILEVLSDPKLTNENISVAARRVVARRDALENFKAAAAEEHSRESMVKLLRELKAQFHPGLQQDVWHWIDVKIAELKKR